MYFGSYKVVVSGPTLTLKAIQFLLSIQDSIYLIGIVVIIGNHFLNRQRFTSTYSTKVRKIQSHLSDIITSITSSHMTK